jgi:hypothetical protein
LKICEQIIYISAATVKNLFRYFGNNFLERETGSDEKWTELVQG